ncbi:hypothetical protein DFQ27_001803 [Actinomortierella ambigua]|uniref:PITH domain-containing protein n=1 Tax=Actinomortierella ambigua TaxID=1343610 RepID=A0A9P6QDS1_9FUNG|nr:hypothetical protein DFQ27_001803 [Actinomortierella ambigua]
MSHHCHDEAHDHDHDHHGHDGHDHSHDRSPDEDLVHGSLLGKIDRDLVVCLNESAPGQGKAILKPWADKMDDTKVLESDADEQLILFIPFTASVRIKSISIRYEPGETAPSKVKAFTNREDVDFDTAESMEPTQEFDLVDDTRGQVIEYVTKYEKEKNHTQSFKQDPIITVYELQANPADHKVPGAVETFGHTLK